MVVHPKHIQQVLKQYGLYSDHALQIGEVYKIITPRGSFMLHALKSGDEAGFLEALAVLDRHRIAHLPIYFTLDGTPFAKTEGGSYYLTPWIEENVRHPYEKWERIIAKLAVLHRKTKTALPSGAAYERPDVRFDIMEIFMDKAEHRVYPSPFEQRIFLLYSRIRGDAERAESLFAEGQDAEGQAVSFCMRRVSCAHVIVYNGETYFLDFTQAEWRSPVTDLADFFRAEKLSSEWMIRLYGQYQTVNPLSREEKKALLANLLFPTPFLKLIASYQSQSPVRELKFITDLHVLCERRQDWQAFFSFLEKDIAESDPALQETNVEADQDDQNDDIESRRPENSTNHLENGKR